MKADDAGWKMESVMASGPSDDDPRKHMSLVNWEGFSHNDNMWETYENVLECSVELLEDYYGKNPLVERDWRFGKKKH